MAIVETTRSITGGVDTHLDTHVVAALDPNGGVLGVAAFPATRPGDCSLSSWLGEFGTIGRIGVEAPVPMAPELLAICAASVSR